MMRKIEEILYILYEAITYIFTVVLLTLYCLTSILRGRKEVVLLGFQRLRKMIGGAGIIVPNLITGKPLSIVYIPSSMTTPERFVQTVTHEWIHYILHRDIGIDVAIKFDDYFPVYAFDYYMMSVNENWKEYKETWSFIWLFYNLIGNMGDIRIQTYLFPKKRWFERRITLKKKDLHTAKILDLEFLEQIFTKGKKRVEVTCLECGKTGVVDLSVKDIFEFNFLPFQLIHEDEESGEVTEKQGWLCMNCIFKSIFSGWEVNEGG